MLVYDIAVELGKYPAEVEAQLTWRGLWEWVAYFKIKAERERDAIRSAKTEAESKARSKARR